MRISRFIACLTICSLPYLTSCTYAPSDLAVSPSPSLIINKEEIPEPSGLVVVPSLPSTEVSPIPTTDAKELVKEILNAKIIYNPDITFDELKQSVKLGEHFDETIKILGNEYDTYPSYYEHSAVIRYYYANVEDHSYQFTHILDNGVEDFDQEGLLNDKLKYGLSIFYDDDEVDLFCISYKHTDGKIHVYYEWVNGYSKEDIL